MTTANRLLTANDTPGQYPPSYYAATSNKNISTPTLDNNLRTDICIIGGGLTGLSAALHAAQLGYNVVVLEANRIAWGASGRNGGQMGTGQRLDPEELIPIAGEQTARQLWDLSLEAVQLCRNLIRDHSIDCDLADGVIHANHRRRFSKDTVRHVDFLQNKYHYPHIQYLDEKILREEIGSDAYYSGSIDNFSAHCHPLNYSLGLADAAITAGAKIYENSLVTGFRQGSPANVTVASGLTVTANSILLCCNGYLENLSRPVACKVMPINNYIIATEPLTAEKQASLIRRNVAVADSKFVINYFRFSKDRRLLFGGGESYGYKFPPDIKQFVRRHMLEIYPQLCNTRIDYGWGGTLAITMSRMPYFDRLDGNILTASGYSGHGLALATLAGKLMAEAIHGNMTKFDLMAKLPSKNFIGGPLLRSPLLALAMTYYSLLDHL